MIDIGGKTIDSIYIGAKEVQKIEIGGKTAYEKSAPIDYMYIENTYEGQNTITFTTTQNGGPSSSDYSDTVEYSKDKTNWTTMTFDTATPQTVTLNQGEKLYLRNDGGKFNFRTTSGPLKQYYTTITGSENHKVGGDILSIYNYNIIDTQPTISKGGCFQRLFEGDSKLVDASDLKIGFVSNTEYVFELAFKGCSNMVAPPDFSGFSSSGSKSREFSGIFEGCSSMTTPPDFSGITGIIGGAVFADAFKGCSAMTTPPDLSGITGCSHSAFQSIFEGCSSMTTPPDLSNLSGNVGAGNGEGFVWAFKGCSSMTTPPDFSNITAFGSMGLRATFSGCTSLTTPPDLSGLTNINNEYFSDTFSGCSSLTTAPDFSNVTSVGNRMFSSTFWGCRSLTTPPDFSNVTSVDDYGFSSTFYGCTSMTTPPDLSNITSIGNTGMASMFYGCTALTTAPDLSGITSISSSGMTSMFYNCTALTTGPDLSGITSVGSYGMANMFNSCTSLTTGPDLSGITSVSDQDGMYNMFRRCARLTTAYAPNVSTWGGTADWLNGVAASGNLYCPSQAVADIIPTGVVYGCPSGWTKVVPTPPTPPDYLYVENTYSGQNTITLTTDDWGGSTSPHSTSVQYSKDKSTWTTVNFSSTPATITMDQGEKLYFRNNSGAFNTMDYSTTITGSQSHIVGGDPRSLLDYTDISNTALVYGCFCNLFKDDTTLTSAALMTTPTDVAEGSYRYCFAGCTAMTEGPWLNATVIDDYSYAHMFDGCSSLNEIRCEATDISATDCTIDWLNGVAATGTFYDYGTPGFTTGPSGTPAGWTVITSQSNPS